MHLLWISNTGIFYVRMKLNDPSYSRKTIEYGNLGDNEMPELKEEENKLMAKEGRKKLTSSTLMGLEPTIFGSGGRRLIH